MLLFFILWKLFFTFKVLLIILKSAPYYLSMTFGLQFPAGNEKGYHWSPLHEIAGQKISVYRNCYSHLLKSSFFDDSENI